MVRTRSFLTDRCWVLVGIAALSLVAVCGAQDGRGLSLKAGTQTFTSPLTGEETTRTRFELEVSTSRYADGRIDLALAFGGSSLGTLRDASTTVEDGLITDAFSVDELSVYDVRLAARFYPLGGGRRDLTPYVGAGLGYFRFVDCWDDTVSVTDTASGITVTEAMSGMETVADGFFPFVIAGLTMSLGDRAELFAELEYDLSKRDKGYDLGGPAYLIGCRVRF